jgi:hypothetical protein
MNLIKNGLPEFKKIEIKYSFEGFELGNNLPYRNFPWFETEFELKIREDSRVEIQ